MNKVYDNGALMLGNIKMVIEEIEKEIKEDLDMCFVDQNELLKDLKEYFRYQIASQCMTGSEEKEGFTNEVREICGLLDNLEEDLQLYPDYETMKISIVEMGNFIIERED